MDGKKVISVTVGILTIVASLITIDEFISTQLSQKQIKQDPSVTIDEPITRNKKERTFIGKLWHDAFSDERIPVKERWATRHERYDEVQGVFHRLAFTLFYIPIGGFIVIILSCIASPFVCFFLLGFDDFRGISGKMGLVVSFLLSLYMILGLWVILGFEMMRV